MEEGLCLLQKIQHIIGRKWTILILEEIKSNGPAGFNELENKVNGITSKILSERLDELVSTQLLEKIILQETPLKVKYRLSEKGYAFLVIFSQMKDWGSKYGLTQENCVQKNCNECTYRT